MEEFFSANIRAGKLRWKGREVLFPPRVLQWQLQNVLEQIRQLNGEVKHSPTPQRQKLSAGNHCRQIDSEAVQLPPLSHSSHSHFTTSASNLIPRQRKAESRLLTWPLSRNCRTLQGIVTRADWKFSDANFFHRKMLSHWQL